MTVRIEDGTIRMSSSIAFSGLHGLEATPRLLCSQPQTQQEVPPKMHGSSVVLVALLTSVATAAGTTYLIQRYDVFPEPQVVRDVAMPELVGLSEADARANAQALGLSLLVEKREPAAGVAEGAVLRQAVKAGQPVPLGSTIGVVFAAALPRVPAVTGLGLAEAEQALKAAGFEPGAGAPVPSDTVEAGLVVRQVPEASSELKQGGEVTLHVSSGPGDVPAPKVTGLGLRAARDKLREVGLEPKVRWIAKAETVSGVVLSQRPAPGEKLAPKSEVEVVVNR